MNFKFNVISNRPAPIRTHASKYKTTWSDFFNSLNVGDWFAVTNTEHDRVQASAAHWKKGKYSLYLSNEYPEGYIFLLHSE
tara:strand:- start:916 stop:1158 length:243 start_codon:yes stop_codon:yes gene_type:complete